MEQLLHYVWKHRMLPLGPLTTTDGRPVEVVDPGLYNRQGAGPDFFNAKVRIGGTLWVGNVEIHLRSADWYQHGHDRDARYDNVVLHVTSRADADVLTSAGHTVPQLELAVPDAVKSNYAELLSTDRYPPCYSIIPQLSSLVVHAWMAALQTERLEQKTITIAQRAQRAAGSWEDAYFQTLARNYGFGINGDAFELWARSIPLSAVGHHRDDMFQVEAFFMGQAGLLQPDSIPQRHRQAALADDYYLRLSREYQFLSHKFGLQPISHSMWHFLRLRPQNFPHIRLSQLVRLYCERRTSLASLLDCTTADDMRRLLSTSVTPYWTTHYGFGVESKANAKKLSAASLDLIIVNTAIPILFAVGRHRQSEALCQRAFDLLEQMKPEHNHIVSLWQECGLNVSSAADSQALIQLRRQYCDRRDCLRCRFGYEYLKRSV